MSYQTELEKIVQEDFAELYDFEILGAHYRYTSYQRDVEYGGEIYIATAGLKRSDWSNEGELKPVQLKISLVLNSLFSQFVSNYPLPKINLTLTRVFLSDLSAAFKLFDGELISIVITNTGAELTCEAASFLYSSLVPKFVHQAHCNHNLFDAGCALDEFVFRVVASGVIVVGSSVQHAVFDTYADGYFNWGYVKTVEGLFRLITNHVGDTLSLQSSFPATSLQTGGTVTAWPGCLKSKEVCQTKFNNFSNFLGFPFIPSHNPAIFGIELE